MPVIYRIISDSTVLFTFWLKLLASMLITMIVYVFLGVLAAHCLSLVPAQWRTCHDRDMGQTLPGNLPYKKDDFGSRSKRRSRDKFTSRCNNCLPGDVREFWRAFSRWISQFWDLFSTIAELKEDGATVIIQYLPTMQYDDQLHLNIWNGHLSYITLLTTYVKKFQCLLCDHLFNKIYNLKTHVETFSQFH